MQTWRLIRDKNHDGITNMAIDEAISIACGEEKSPATLRLYGWKTPVVSIGYSQKTESDINLQYCDSMGIDIVKRPTGGRAVLHENELTFSVNASIENPLFPKNILKSHKKISEAVLSGLNRMGINAELQYKSKNRQSRNHVGLPPGLPTKIAQKKPFTRLPCRHPVCFSAASLYELVVDGKKIVGCAQRRFKNSFLEHGSIPLKLDRSKLSSIFKNGLSSSEKKLDSLYFNNMAGLNELGLNSFSLNQIIENLLKGFEQHFGIVFKEDSLSNYEKELMKKIRPEIP